MQTHVVVECRGKKEDRELELEFRRVCDGDGGHGRLLPFHIVFADKKTNLVGLQVADLVARPVGIHHLRPAQPNQAFEVLTQKFFCDGEMGQLNTNNRCITNLKLRSDASRK